MKVTKTSPQPKFQPIELNITIESEDEFNWLLHLYRNSPSIYNVCIDQPNLDFDAVEFLDRMLNSIGESL